MRLGCLRGISPIFIVGMGRSGTTPLQLSLSMHPAISVFGETAAFVLPQKYGSLSRPSQMRRFLRDWKQHLQFTPHRGLVEDAELLLRLRACTTYADVLNRMIGTIALGEAKVRWGEKTPRHIFYLREILSCFPDARIVHIIRDPRAAVSSAIRAFERGKSTAFNVYHFTRYWLRCIDVHKAQLLAKNPNYLAVRYEDFVVDTEATLRKICQFTGIDYSPELLNFQRRAKDYVAKDAEGNLVAHHLLTAAPLSPDRVGAWRSQLPEAGAAIVERLAGTEMLALGYEPECKGGPNPFQLAWLALRWRLKRVTQACRTFVQRAYWWLRRGTGYIQDLLLLKEQ